MSRASASVSGASPWTRAELEDELGRVHAREFARLLCCAAFLRLAARNPAVSRVPAAQPGMDLAGWRRAASRARRLAEIDGYELDGLLRHTLGRPSSAWADPERLLRAARALDDSEATRWHAAALACFEARPGAREQMASFAVQAMSSHWRSLAFDLLQLSPEEPPPW